MQAHSGRPHSTDGGRMAGVSGRGAGAPRVLLAEDDVELRALISQVLRQEGYEVLEAVDGDQLFKKVAWFLQAGERCRPIDVVITDVRMPRWSGLEVLAAVRTTGSTLPFIVITAFGDRETHEKARALQAAAVFDKPFDIADLKAAVRLIAPVMPRSASGSTSSPVLRVLLAQRADRPRALLAVQLKMDGHEVVEVSSEGELKAAIDDALLGREWRRSPFDMIVTDIGMPGLSCFDTVEYIREAGWDVPVVLMTAFREHHTRERAEKLPHAVLFTRPFEIQELRAALHHLSIRRLAGGRGHGHVL